MRLVAILLIFLVGIGAGVLATQIVEITQIREARLPKITFEGGQLPEYDVEVGDIEVTEEGVQITRPSGSENDGQG